MTLIRINDRILPGITVKGESRMHYESKYEEYFKDKPYDEAIALIVRKDIQISEVKYGYIDSGYYGSTRSMLVSGVTKDKRVGNIGTSVVLSKDRIIEARCQCKEFQMYYWGRLVCCKHVIALALLGEDEAKNSVVDLETDRRALTLLDKYAQRDFVELLENEEDVELEPSFHFTYHEWKVSFKIGTKKKYVIKNLTEFYERMQQSEQFEYGKDFTFIHKKSAFAKSSWNYLEFILERIEESIVVRGMQKDSYRSDVEIKRTIPLTPGSVDKLLPTLIGKEVQFAVEDIGEKERGKARVIEQKPMLELNIQPIYENESKMSAVQLWMTASHIFYGNEHTYCYQYNKIVISNPEFAKTVNPLLQTIHLRGKVTFGKIALQGLYEKVLPTVSNYIDIKEEDGERIREELPEKIEVEFFLDETEEHTIFVEVKGTQQGVELDFSNVNKLQNYGFELEWSLITTILNRYMQEQNGNIIYIDNDEDVSYEFLTVGAKELLRFGVVHVSDSLKKKTVRKVPKISVGVQVKSDILNLQLQSDDIDFLELHEILKSYKSKKKFYKLKDGTFLPLEGESLDTMIELMDGLQLQPKDFTKEQLEIPAYRALYIDKLFQGKEDVSYERDKQLKEIVRNFRTVEDGNYEVPKHLKSILRNYQKVGYRWLCLLGEYGFNGILADDMGLGKTLQIITLLQAKKRKGRTSLIVTPASLVYNWEHEVERFGQGLKVAVVAGTPSERKTMIEDVKNYDVVVTSYDLLKRDIAMYKDISFFYQAIDEAQYIKNQNAQVSKAVKLIRAKHKIALTGTPIENRLSELWSIFDYLMPGYLFQYDKFKSRFESVIVKQKDDAVVKRLKEMVSPFILRRLKKDVLKDLPDKLEEVVYAKMEKTQTDLYTAYVAKVKQELDEQGAEEFRKNKLKVLAEITRLRQICCDPNLIYDNYKGESAKLETCMELIQNAKDSGHKVLLFSQFTTMLELIEKRLVEAGVESYKITGATPKGKRLQLVDEFNKNDVTVFLISLKAGGTGLNLTGADMVIHYDPWWNVAAQNQATDRAHRIGQKNVVTVFQLIAKGTIEEKIIQMQKTKKELADQIISGEENQLSTMNKDDFINLLSQE